MVIHQGIEDSHDTMSSKNIIISFFGPHIMPIPKTLKDIMKDIGTGRDDHIDQFHLDHISNHFAQSTRDHCSGQSQEDDTGRISEHLPENFKTFKDVSAL